MTNSILIVGADGQVGQELRRLGSADSVALGHKDLDICNLQAVRAALQRHRPYAVINAAAYTAVDKAEQESERAFAVNRDGPAHLAHSCHEFGIPLLHISTDYVFDGSKPEPYLETDTPVPRGVYAQSKWEGEQRIRELLPAHIILRTSWVFGQYGNNFVKTMVRLARERPELRVVADQHGAPTSAVSIASALLQLARQLTKGPLQWGTYHYTGTPDTTWHGFACAIVEEAAAMGLIARAPLVHPIATRDYPVPAPRPANSRLDCRGAEQVLGLKRQHWRHDLRDVLSTFERQAA